MKISGGEPVLFCEGFTTKISQPSTLQLEIQDQSLQQAITGKKPGSSGGQTVLVSSSLRHRSAGLKRSLHPS